MSPSDFKAPPSEHYSVAAVLAYLSFALLMLSGIGVFCMVVWQVTVENVLVGIVAGFLATVYSLANQAWGFFLGSSVGGKTANAALAQLAGAGAPPPASPLADTPPETK